MAPCGLNRIRFRPALHRRPTRRTTPASEQAFFASRRVGAWAPAASLALRRERGELVSRPRDVWRQSGADPLGIPPDVLRMAPASP